MYRRILLLLTLTILLTGTIQAAPGAPDYATIEPNSSILNKDTSDGYDKGNSMATPKDRSGFFMDGCYTVANIGVLSAKRNRVKIGDIMGLFSSYVKQGEIVGVGKTPVASEGKVRAFRNLLVTAESLIEINDIVGACQQIKDAHLKSDGQMPNYDYITGPAAPKLNEMIKSLMVDLRC